MGKIIFCFPYRGVGGVSLLFARFASYLHKNGLNVAIVDYSDGYMAQNIKELVDVMVYNDDIKLSIPMNSVLVLQTMTPWSIYPMLDVDDSVKMYFITTLPSNLYPFVPVFRTIMSEGGKLASLLWHTVLYGEYNKIRVFHDIMARNEAICYLDNDIVNTLSKTLRVIIQNPVIVPLLNEQMEMNYYIKNNTFTKSYTKFTFAWVGRLVDFKIHILNKLIQDMEILAVRLRKNIEIIIVGSGSHHDKLTANNLSKVRMKYIENIPPRDLDKFLLTLDALFAMGTAALDGARMGVPTVRLDYSFKPIKNEYFYKWLYEVDDYSLANQIGTRHYNSSGHTLENIVYDIIHFHKTLSMKTFEYYQKNHSVNVVSEKLINSIYRTKLTYVTMQQNNLLHSTLYLLWKKMRG